MSFRADRPDAWHSLLQRGVDTAAEVAESIAERLSAAADPRAKLLRKRRWALRAGVFFSISCLFWLGVTGLLSAWELPFWALFIPAPIAVGAGFLATLAFARYRWLRAEPLPPPRTDAGRRLPPRWSAARRPMSDLAAAERALYSLLGVLQRGRMLPGEELRELMEAANRSAAAMAATANEVVAMEQAIRSAPHSRAHLEPTITAYTAQLYHGGRQYHALVDAAARLVSAVNSEQSWSSPITRQRYRDEVSNATDRLLGWAQAFDELGRLRSA
ncbi:putative alanine rich transmembrane protein [Mycolicibacterium hassiacum DSM 44199]|uniref:Putative alanine rich transmembrane protein n=1 Tax=Mycolicibacterium hassiacum (strain DSM 44199 / CIP 105218 / JCM 12690 / 3849) TaxID=1122247 RepID=K5BBJ3_MYCHD|nr:hypothetical protein [Mycolicibacterium hassiacum]EKF24090.1 putative alanine rich transmembrane protein [Mycolicibacterium hassiacum DSM 44199]MDA4085161.1 membrane protein [Mycolicibacterium hassiacum DSM 44199]VCT90671.1 hypothetical protein MHAS_02380 [Mycolicibacterium hassiacum DSM 44199]